MTVIISLKVFSGTFSRTDVHFRPSHPESELVEPLSEREIDVLQLIAAGHKYQEVAVQLVISLNTVRHHTKNIYSKLEVNNRAQAIKKANDLNLL